MLLEHSVPENVKKLKNYLESRLNAPVYNPLGLNLSIKVSGQHFCFSCFVFFIINLFLLVFNLPTYRITPSAHPVKCPPQCPSPIHPHPPSSPSTTPSSFPRVRSLHVLSPFLIFLTHFFSLPFYSLSL